MKRYILNTPVLTNYGTFRFVRINVEQARQLAQDAESAVGHRGAADALSALLGMEVITNRIEVNMAVGDVALVFRLMPRLPEGAILSAAETLDLPYEFGRLERIA
jgi:hypothetical protein